MYAWLLPGYVSWYALVPKQAGGKIISDSLTLFVFILFLLLSIPTGFHHQYVFIFARGMISAGLEGMPRRVYLARASYRLEEWELGGALTGIGGTLMFVGIFIFFIVIGVTIFVGKKGAGPTDIPWSETLTAPKSAGWEVTLDRLWISVVVAILLIAVAYGPFLATYVPPNFVSPGFRFF